MDRDFSIKEGGWFPVMNELASRMITMQMSGAEHRLFWLFMRECYGYQNSCCKFRWSELKELSGLSRSQLLKALDGLIKRKMIKSFKKETKTYITYKINSKLSQWNDEIDRRYKPKKSFKKETERVSKKKLKSFKKETSHLLYKDNIKTVKDTITKKQKKGFFAEQAKTVLAYLNEKKGSRYRDHSFIIPRLKSGATVEDCIKVIDNKMADPYFQEHPRFLCPETLFRKSKFDKYLNDNPHPLAGIVSEKTQRNIEVLKQWEAENAE